MLSTVVEFGGVTREIGTWGCVSSGWCRTACVFGCPDGAAWTWLGSFASPAVFSWHCFILLPLVFVSAGRGFVDLEDVGGHVRSFFFQNQLDLW